MPRSWKQAPHRWITIGGKRIPMTQAGFETRERQREEKDVARLAAIRGEPKKPKGYVVVMTLKAGTERTRYLAGTDDWPAGRDEAKVFTDRQAAKKHLKALLDHPMVRDASIVAAGSV